VLDVDFLVLEMSNDLRDKGFTFDGRPDELSTTKKNYLVIVA
jgi:hypothetical protein